MTTDPGAPPVWEMCFRRPGYETRTFGEEAGWPTDPPPPEPVRGTQASARRKNRFQRHTGVHPGEMTNDEQDEAINKGGNLPYGRRAG